MKRAWAATLVAVVTGATIGIASPARAENCFAYFEEAKDFDFQAVTVDVENLKVTISPDGAMADVAMLRAELEDILGIFLCLEGGTVSGAADCLSAKAAEIAGSLDPANLNLRYVYRDPSTGAVSIDGGLLVADATACLP